MILSQAGKETGHTHTHTKKNIQYMNMSQNLYLQQSHNVTTANESLNNVTQLQSCEH